MERYWLTPPMEMHSLRLPDGRAIEVATVGSPAKEALIFHHGTPGSWKTWEGFLKYVESQGAFAIAFSRAGYGESARHTGRTVIDNVKDVQFLLNHFGVEKFVSIGWSGGGPHCLADTTLPANKGAISIAGVAEFGSDDLDFLEGMGEENHVEFGAAIEGVEAIDAWMKKYSGDSATVTGPQIIEALGGLIGDADKKALDAEVAEAAAAGFRHALSVSYYGWMDDDLAFVKPWGFDIGSITKPVELWQGDDDFMVPHAHGKWLAGRIPTAELIFVPGEGHISLGENKKPEIIASAARLLG